MSHLPFNSFFRCWWWKIISCRHLFDRPRLKPITEDPTNEKTRFMIFSEKVKRPGKWICYFMTDSLGTYPPDSAVNGNFLSVEIWDNWPLSCMKNRSMSFLILCHDLENKICYGDNLAIVCILLCIPIKKKRETTKELSNIKQRIRISWFTLMKVLHLAGWLDCCWLK